MLASLLCWPDNREPPNWDKEQVADFLLSVAPSSEWVRNLAAFAVANDVDGATFDTCFSSSIDGGTDPVTALHELFEGSGMQGPLMKPRLRAVALRYRQLQDRGAGRTCLSNCWLGTARHCRCLALTRRGNLAFNPRARRL
jgi:hypothetical protein